MANFLLDTNHASPLVTVIHPLRVHVLKRISAGDKFYLTVPVIAETLFGLRTTPRAESNVKEWEMLRTQMGWLPVDEQDALYSALLRSVLRRRGRQLNAMHGLIAAVALRSNMILLTTDGDFEAVSGLQT